MIALPLPWCERTRVERGHRWQGVRAGPDAPTEARRSGGSLRCLLAARESFVCLPPRPRPRPHAHTEATAEAGPEATTGRRQRVRVMQQMKARSALPSGRCRLRCTPPHYPRMAPRGLLKPRREGIRGMTHYRRCSVYAHAHAHAHAPRPAKCTHREDYRPHGGGPSCGPRGPVAP